MIQKVIHVRASREQIIAILRRIPAIAIGGETGLAQILMVRMGLVLLGRIKTAFIQKARGGADDSGLRWPPLKKSTVAYSRRHPGVLWPGKKRAPFAPSWMLTQKQRERWWQVYRSVGGRAPQGAGYHARGAPRGLGAAVAWMVLKREGAKTLIGTYGDVHVEILRDTGLLLNSLSPGVVVGESAPVAPPKVENQVFRVGRGEVIVGTNRKFAATHHRGIPGKLPQRRLWPEVSNWPQNWWTDITRQGVYGLIDIALYLLSRGRL
jgi:hypothetical protein